MSGWKAGENGSYSAPKHTGSLARGSHMRSEGSGVGYGLSSYQGFDSENYGPMYCYDRDPLTGNATERVKPYTSTSVTEKGLKLDIC